MAEPDAYRGLVRRHRRVSPRGLAERRPAAGAFWLTPGRFARPEILLAVFGDGVLSSARTDGNIKITMRPARAGR